MISVIPPAPSATTATSALALSQHIISSGFTVSADLAAYVPRYVEISAGITLEIAANGDLEIG